MGIHAFGTTLSSASTGSIGTITSISVSGPTRDAVEVSNFSSADSFREYIPGMIDPGQITGTIRFDKTTVNSFINGIEAAPEIWTITFSDGSTFECSGFLTTSPVGGGDFESDLTGDFTIKLTGAPTFTPAT